MVSLVSLRLVSLPTSKQRNGFVCSSSPQIFLNQRMCTHGHMNTVSKHWWIQKERVPRPHPPQGLLLVSPGIFPVKLYASTLRSSVVCPTFIQPKNLYVVNTVGSWPDARGCWEQKMWNKNASWQHLTGGKPFSPRAGAHSAQMESQLAERERTGMQRHKQRGDSTPQSQPWSHHRESRSTDGRYDDGTQSSSFKQTGLMCDLKKNNNIDCWAWWKGSDIQSWGVLE